MELQEVVEREIEVPMKRMFRIQRMKDKDWDESEFCCQEDDADWNDCKKPRDSSDEIEMKPGGSVFIWSDIPKCWEGEFEVIINHTEHCKAEATNDKKETTEEEEIDPELVDDGGVDGEGGVVKLNQVIVLLE
jgi:hypothetical protein